LSIGAQSAGGGRAHPAAAMHSFYLRNMYQRNLLSKPGGITLAGTPIDLTKINAIGGLVGGVRIGIYEAIVWAILFAAFGPISTGVAGGDPGQAALCGDGLGGDARRDRYRLHEPSRLPRSELRSQYLLCNATRVSREVAVGIVKEANLHLGS
jgi:hypothetical protein